MDFVAKKWAVIPFIFFQMVSLSTLYYIMPQFVITKVCHWSFNRTICSQIGQPKLRAQESHIFDEAAVWNAVIQFATLFPSLIITLPLGAATDLVSKKKMLLVPAIANLISCLINLCCSIFIKLHVGFLALSSFITSIYGEKYGCTMLCCAYASSVASACERTVVLTAVIIGAEVGFGIGSLVGNYLVEYYGYPTVFMFVGTDLTIGLLYAVVLIPSIDDTREKHTEEEAGNLWSDFKAHMKDTWIHLVSFTKRHILNSKDKTILLLLIAVFFQLASDGGQRSLVPLFLKHSPLTFSADKVGNFLSLQECSQAAGLILLATTVEKYFTVSDYTLMILGALSMWISATFLSFSKTALMVYLSNAFAVASAFLPPSATSQLTKLVSSDEYGVALSFLGLVGSISMLVMAVGVNGLFVATVKVFTGFSILLMASTNLVSLVILFYIVFTEEGRGSKNDNYNKVAMKDNDSE